MPTFLLNPYDGDLDLTNKDDRKLFQDACKGLEKENLFDGKKQNFQDFAKLLEVGLKKTRVMEALAICTEWDETASAEEDRKLPTAGGTVDSFKSKQVTPEQVRAHSELVWGTTAFGSATPKYFKSFIQPPTTTEELEKERNKRRLKHVMLGWKLWNSLTASFQIDIMGGKTEYERNDECDGPLLWDYIRRRVNPSTTVGASKLKDEIESKKLADFDHDVIRYNTWFCDTREEIMKEEGEGFSEYLRSLFRAYQSSDNQEFLDAIAEEKRRWTQGRLQSNYSYLELMELGRLTYNNLVDDDSWSTTKKKVEREKEKNFLALATEILEQTRTNGNGRGRTPNPDNNDESNRTRNYQEWRFSNPDGAKTKVVEGTTMKWCTNDCHKQPMWCGRRNCMGRSDFAKHMQNKRGKGSKKEGPDGNKSERCFRANDEFKMSLAALTTPEDYAILDEQFFQVKD